MSMASVMNLLLLPRRDATVKTFKFLSMNTPEAIVKTL
jgi:hypothetical protein